MEIILLSLESAASLVIRMGSVMFISLFGIELFMQMGLMKHIAPLGRPVAKLANLPSESAVSFLSAIGSMVAAHTMAAGFHSDHRMTDQELVLTGVLNTVPFHFKEILTFQLPIVLPLLGGKLCLIYIAAFWLTGLIKLGFVLFWGHFYMPKTRRAEDAFDTLECDPLDPECVPRSWGQLLKDTWHARKKMFFRMISLLGSITFLIQVLIHSGLLNWFEAAILPITAIFNLPPAVVGPISTYVFSPTAGIAYMSNLLNQQAVSDYQAIVSLLAGSLLMIPVTRLRRTLPRYTAIFGLKHGFIICGLTTGLSLLSRILILIWVIFFFSH